MTDSEIGRYAIVNGDSLEIMKNWDKGIVDSVITDPPYVGLGFTPENYFERLGPFAEQMLRFVGESGRLAISQPFNRLKQTAEMFGSGTVVQIEDAFEDRRGEHAFFVLRNPIPERSFDSENWSDMPGTLHPNPRDVNKMAGLIKVMSNPGDTILDPFCGSAAIGLASVLLGRDFIGIELLEDRAEDAENRLLSIGATRLEI